MANLMLHCGARHVDRQQVDDAATPPRTQTWVPIPHTRLLDQVEQTLRGNGLSIVSQAHALWREDARYFGLMEVANGHTAGDYNMVVGLRNSHDQSFPAGLVLGTAVFVCDNLSFCGEVKLARKHTRFIERDLPELVQRAVGKLTDLRVGQDRRIEAYKETNLRDARVHDLVVRALDARVVPVTQVPRVLEEWRQPRHPEFAEHGRTAWRLFNAFTEALKGRNLPALPRRTQALHGLLDGACGLRAVSAN